MVRGVAVLQASPPTVSSLVAGLGQESSGARGVIPSPSVAPEGTSMERLYSPWRGLFHPDMMCLTKAGKEDKDQPLHVVPLYSILSSWPPRPCPPSLYCLTSNLPTAPSPV